MTANDKLLTVQRVAQFLQVSDDTVRRLLEAGDIRSTRVGRQLRVFETSTETDKPKGLKEYLLAQE